MKYKIILIALWICSFFIALRMNYEATFLTWEKGPQMVGFSFSHSYGIFFIFALLCLIILTILSVFKIVVNLVKRTKTNKIFLSYFFISVFVIAINLIPYSYAQYGMLLVNGLPKEPKYLFTNSAFEGNLGIMKLMIEKGYKPDSTVFNSGLYNACFNGHIEVIEYSLMNGANINMKSGEYKITPLMIAAENNEFKTIEYLLDNGADAKIRDNSGLKKTALDYAIKYNNNESIVILKNKQFKTVPNPRLNPTAK